MNPTPQGRVILTRDKVADFHPRNDTEAESDHVPQGGKGIAVFGFAPQILFTKLSRYVRREHTDQ